ncbi:MAG: PRC-barrel domain-containing protein [Mesorhizobium sp.]
MIRNLLATTAVATLLASGAFAQNQPAPAEPVAPAPEQTAPAVVPAEGHLATNLIGETVYNGTGDEAENIGDVNDLVIGKEGDVESIIIGVGGFLGIGEKNVAMEFDTIEWAEKDGDRWIVVAGTKDELNALPAFDRKPYDPQLPATTATDTMAPAPTAPAPTAEAPVQPPADQPATAEAPATEQPAAEAPATTDKPATAEAPAAPDTTATDETKTAAVDKSQLKEMPVGEIGSEELVGTTVYGANDENIGEIGDVMLTTDGKIDSVILDVGGFLGVGEKKVAVGMDNLAFMTDDSGNKYLYTSFSKEQLDAAAAFDKATYTEKRDDQRLIMQ